MSGKVLTSLQEVRDRVKKDIQITVVDKQEKRYIINRNGNISKISVIYKLVSAVLSSLITSLLLLLGAGVFTIILGDGASFLTPLYIVLSTLLIMPFGLMVAFQEYRINADLTGKKNLVGVDFGDKTEVSKNKNTNTPKREAFKNENSTQSQPIVYNKTLSSIEKYKKAILLDDDRIKFVYELVDLKKSKPNELVCKGVGSGLTLEQVKGRGDKIKYKAMELYIKNERLEDSKIELLINTYNEILQYEEDKKVREQYQKYLDNKGEDTAIKILETSKQGIISDIANYRDERASYIEENQKIIASIK